MNKSQPDIGPNEPRAASDDFWLKANEPSLDLIWDNPEDDMYAELLEAGVPFQAAVTTFDESRYK